MRLAVRVHPRSTRTGVGGRRGDALVVRVQEPQTGGRANEAAVRALAASFGVPRRSVRIVSGAKARQKVVEVEGDEADLVARAAALLEGSSGTDRP
jgi:uncharacterized protein